MSLTSPLLIFCFDQEESQAIAELARLLGYPDAQIVTGSVDEAIKAINQRALPPDYILIDIGEHKNDVLTQLDEFALHCEPDVRVAIIGSINDIHFYRELKQRGIVEYFTRPVQASDIRPVLMQAPQGAGLNSASVQGSVISFMSAASGDGASTCALNLAYCLAQEYRQPTVLVDMDYQFGLVAKSLDLAAPFGLRELFDHPDRGLDHLLVGKMLVRYRERLNIIAAPNDLRLMPPIRPEVIRELVKILRTQFRFVIVDVPHVWTDWTAAALAYSDHTVMVAQLWLRSLTHASRLLTAWQEVGISRSAVSLAINRSGAKFKEAITAEDFERICHHKIEATFPNDIKAIAHAENNGKTIFETGQGLAIQQQVKDFAALMMSRCQVAAPPPSVHARAAAGKKGLLALFDKRGE